MHQLHHASDEQFVARIHTALSAMRSSVCDSSQAKQGDANTASGVFDEPREADAGGRAIGSSGHGKQGLIAPLAHAERAQAAMKDVA